MLLEVGTLQTPLETTRATRCSSPPYRGKLVSYLTVNLTIFEFPGQTAQSNAMRNLLHLTAVISPVSQRPVLLLLFIFSTL